ncbi:MAG: response regulator [Deltaproteobacteria bacterium]
MDDHRETAENVCTLLSTLGHDAVLAENGTTALALAQQFDPDVALLDIDLPDISGYELARRLRSAQSHPLFLAAVTGWAQGRDSAPALAAGFDRHVLKPTTADMIRSILEQASQSTALVP